jgi:hypothetical protein
MGDTAQHGVHGLLDPVERVAEDIRSGSHLPSQAPACHSLSEGTGPS